MSDRIELWGEAYAEVEGLAELMDLSITEVVREALSVLAWLAKERQQGTRLLVQRGSEVTALAIRSLDQLAPADGDEA